MKKLFIDIKFTKQNDYQLEQMMFHQMVNDYFCFDTYEDLAGFIRQYCFTESKEFESNIPFDSRFEEFESDPEDDDAYDNFYESLTEQDFEDICYDYKRNYKIEYIEFDVDQEIKYLKDETKELLDAYTDKEQKYIMLNFIGYTDYALDSYIVDMFDCDEVEFAEISSRLKF